MLCLTGTMALLLFSRSARAEEEEPNNGEDLGRQPTLFDLRWQYQNQTDGAEKETFILRRNLKWALNDQWQIATRFDVPLVLAHAGGVDPGMRQSTFGLGDLLWQPEVINSPTERLAWSLSARFIFPSATDPVLGAGRWQIDPQVGVRWKLPEISRGSFFQFIARFENETTEDFARTHLSEVRMSPTLNVALPERWFVTLFPSQDIVLDCHGNHQWFVPADFLIGRNLTDRIVASLEVSVPLIRQVEVYDFKVEARLSFHF